MATKILIVDDDSSIRKGLSLALGDRYDVVTASNGIAALELFPNEKPDIVLLDIGLSSSSRPTPRRRR